MRLLLVVVLVACTPKVPVEPAAAEAAAEVVSGELGTRLHTYLERLEPYGMSGVALVAKDGEIVLHAGYGHAVRAGEVPLTADTPLIIGSLSKQFASAAILELESQGKLSRTDTLGRFFPDVPADKQGITLEQLMTHTAGLPYLPKGDFLEEIPRDAVMQEVFDEPLLSAPGERYAYSSPGYTLLAGVVEAATGESYEAFVGRELFAEAGMTESGFMGEPRWAKAPPVHSYSDGEDEGSLVDFPGVAKGVGAGDVVTTAGDLYQWHVALRQGAVLPPAMVEAFYAPRVATEQPGVQYGYGWNVIDTPRGRIVGHGGDLGGYNADMRYYVDRDMVVVFLSNARVNGPGWRQAVMNNLSLLASGDPYAAPPALVSVPAATLEAWEGRYELPSGGVVEASVDDGALVLSARSQEPIRLLSGAPAESTPMSDALNARTGEVADATARGDYEPLKEALSPSLPFGGLGEALDADRAKTEAELGPFQGVEVLGTAVRSPGAAETWYTLKYERGERLSRFAWGGGHIVGLETDLDRAMAVPFRPVSETAVVAFDPFTGKTVRVELVGTGQGIAIGGEEARRIGG